MTPKRKPRPRDHVKKLSSIVATPPVWLVGGFISFGNLTLLGGDPGVGKSMLLYDLAARMTTGRPMPGAPPRDPRDVLVIHPEDHGAVVQQRIAAAQGDADRIDVVDQAGPRLTRQFDLTRDLPRIRALAEDHDYGLIIIENLGLLLGDANTEARVRAALHGLSQIAEQTGTVIVAILHLAKARHRQALHAVAGRVAQTGTARSVTIVAPDPDDPNVRVWALAKGNLAPPAMPSLLYDIIETPLGPAVNWLGTSEWSADELLRTSTSPRASKPAEAEHMLREMLADGPRLRSEIKATAANRPIGWRTVENAKVNLAIRHRQIPEPGIRGPGPCWWSLPDTQEGSQP